MKLTRFIALLLCAALLISTFAGCSTTDATGMETPPSDVSETSPSEAAEPTAETAPSGETAAPGGFDFVSAYAAFAPDTVMITVGGDVIKWDELFFYICENISSFQSYYSTSFDLAAEISEEETFASSILKYASRDAISYKAVYYGAELLGVSITDEDRADMDKDYESAVQEQGGEDALLTMLRESRNIHSRELFMYLYGTEYLTYMCYASMFGENSEKVTDDAVDELYGAEGLLCTKHILRKKPDDATDTEGKDRAYKEAQDILSLLKAYDGDDFDSYFDELMFSESEDPGALASFPNGYLFQYGDMMPEFYDACVALEVGGISDIVETTYGYHILYRLPLNYDITPISAYSEGNTATLRQIAATNMFNSKIDDWASTFEPVYSEEYNSLELTEIFKQF